MTTAYDLTIVRTKLQYLPSGLLSHCERVRDVSLSLARRWGASLEKAEFAALTHDLARAMSWEKLVEMARSYDLVRDEVDLRFPLLLHGPVSAEILRREWGVRDFEILEAIACHTSGRVEMTTLDKILLIADKIEPGKTYTSLTKVKELVNVDLDRATLELLDQQILFHVTNRHLIHPATLAARNALLVKIGEGA